MTMANEVSVTSNSQTIFGRWLIIQAYSHEAEPFFVTFTTLFKK